jgi:hypothetical protein
MFLCAANQSGLEDILVPYMRPFFAFLGLLLCLTPTQGDEQAVIKDSEAIRYVGRYGEVRGVVGVWKRLCLDHSIWLEQCSG